MARPPKKIHVLLTRQGTQWQATAVEDSSITIASYNSRSTRLRMSNLIKERFGEGVELEYKVTLPTEEQAALDKYFERIQLFDQLAKDLPVERVAIAEKLLNLHLTQEEVSEAMGISQGHLAMILRRDATASAPPVRPSTRRTTQR
jgi:hypothetical protein